MGFTVNMTRIGSMQAATKCVALSLALGAFSSAALAKKPQPPAPEPVRVVPMHQPAPDQRVSAPTRGAGPAHHIMALPGRVFGSQRSLNESGQDLLFSLSRRLKDADAIVIITPHDMDRISSAERNFVDLLQKVRAYWTNPDTGKSDLPRMGEEIGRFGKTLALRSARNQPDLLTIPVRDGKTVSFVVVPKADNSALDSRRIRNQRVLDSLNKLDGMNPAHPTFLSPR